MVPGSPTGSGRRRLVLLRHARAEPAGGRDDELRPLALAGRRQCAAIGAGLGGAGLAPERVLLSPAVRTRQTWELVRGALGEVPPAEVDADDRLYEASVADVLELIRRTDERVATVLVVGHEPTMSAVAATLTATATDAGVGPASTLLAQVHTGLPTGAFAVLEVDGWVQLARGTAALVDVVRPPT